MKIFARSTSHTLTFLSRFCRAGTRAILVTAPRPNARSARGYSTGSQNPREDAEGHEWPEEDLSAPTDQGGGFYPARLGETFDGGRFVVSRKLGWGGGSSVWLARDLRENRPAALKLLSAYATREHESGQLHDERAILARVASAAPVHPGYDHVNRLLHEFAFDSYAGRHLCFVLGVTACDACALQGRARDRRLPLKFVLRMARDVLRALQYLHDECGIVHCDVKPANILLEPEDVEGVVRRELVEHPSALYAFPKTDPPEKRPIVPVISTPLNFPVDLSRDAHPDARGRFRWILGDFGRSRFLTQPHMGLVQPCGLRPPEVVLGLPWGRAVDIWSLGCLMFEFATGELLFSPSPEGDTPSEVVHLIQMVTRTSQTHDRTVLSEYARAQGVALAHIHHLMDNPPPGVLPSVPLEDDVWRLAVHARSAREVDAFLELVRAFLRLDPDARPRAREALESRAFDGL